MTTVNINDLQKAFALAHKAADAPDVPLRERNYFRAIAHLIWRSLDSERAEEIITRPANLEGFAHLDPRDASALNPDDGWNVRSEDL